MLVYYSGLAQAVGRGKIKTDGFAIKVESDEKSTTPATKDYIATLNWIEPFATKKSQTLRIEIRAWESTEKGHAWLFMSVSPNKTDDAIWKTMREVRDKFIRGS